MMAARRRTLEALTEEIDARAGRPFPQAGLSFAGEWSVDRDEAALAQALARGRERDAAAGRALAGPHRGDIVVFKPPVASPDNFIKRVIAVPGDTLRIYGGKVYVNGKPTDEPYIAQPPQYNLIVKNYDVYVDEGYGYELLSRTNANIPPRSQWQASNRIPKGFYFVMGDNRNDSDDSHVWGFAQMHGHFVGGPLAKTATTAQFTGRAFLLLWPFNRLRILD